MPHKADSRTRQFKLAKFISWSFFVLILGSNLVLSVFLANFARQTLLEKQKEYAELLAENINHQVFQRFTMPTLIGFGHIKLSNEAQYEHLEKVIQTTIHGFHILDLRIYDFETMVSYALNRDLVGKTGLAGEAVKASLESGSGRFEIVSRFAPWRTFFKLDLEPESVVLKTVYTMRADRRLSVDEPAGPIMGVLEFTQDITSDYQTVIDFQRLIILATFFSSLALFFILIMILYRADRMTAERAQAQEKLERELLQSEKLASMGRMVAGIAHEIRNPLGIIRSSSELLYNKSKSDNNSNTRILQAIFEESKRLSRTVNDFLDYARPKPPKQEDVDLAKVLEQVTVFLEPKSKEQGVSLSRDLGQSGRKLFVKGDKDLLYRAFYNLLANSLDALDGAGEIRVSAKDVGGEIILVFTDTGPGFPPELLEKALDPFFTTKDTGTGLGLAIVKTILNGHGAKLTLGNSREGGARIEISFPSGA